MYSLAEMFESLISILSLNFQSIVFAIIVALVTYIAFRQTRRLFTRFRVKEKVPAQIINAVDPLVSYLIAFVGILVFAVEISSIFALSELAFTLLPTVLMAAVIVVSTWVLLNVTKYFFGLLLERKKIPSDIVLSIGLVTKYSIIIAGLAISVLNVLSSLGYAGVIWSLILGWFTAHTGRLAVIAAALIFTKIASKLIATFFGDLKSKTNVLQARVAELASTGVRYLLYAIVGLIIFASILSMIGVPELTPLITNVFSVLIGVGLSFAAAGAIGNVISGLILMNWKPYKAGDRVEIGGNTYGDVTDFDVMFTRIVTPTNEVIHLPNSLVLGNKVTKYEPQCLVHPRVAVGYNVGRHVVEDILIKAALMTSGIGSEPKPAVYIRELGKNYVEYELRACTNEPNRLVQLYSDVQKNILDLFGEANIDLMIPQYQLDATLFYGQREEVTNRKQP
jgi:small conductance mechanosensitive channel